MHLSSRLLLGVVATLFGVLSLPTAALAQSRQGDAAIRCESTNGKFNRCAMPWRDARLVRQESKGACVRGESWGVDRQGLWVDRGCRGLFAASSDRRDYRDERPGYGDDSRYDDRAGGDRRGGWQPGPGWDRQIRLQCDSNKKRYQMCQVDVGRRGRVRLVQQMSDARCSEGYSWGWNRAGVWVNHGCRGQFVVDRRW
jgi:hypothetical protein